MSSKTLAEQAWQTYERIARRLDAAVEKQSKFPPRGQRTTAYKALQGHIEYLRKIQANAHKRYLRRQIKEAGPL